MENVRNVEKRLIVVCRQTFFWKIEEILARKEENSSKQKHVEDSVSHLERVTNNCGKFTTMRGKEETIFTTIKKNRKRTSKQGN